MYTVTMVTLEEVTIHGFYIVNAKITMDHSRKSDNGAIVDVTMAIMFLSSSQHCPSIHMYCTLQMHCIYF